MERLNWHIANELIQYARVTVIGPQESKSKSPPSVPFIGVPLKPLWRFLIATLIRSIWLSIKNRPDVVLAGSGLTAPMALISAKLSGGTSAVYLHGLDIAVNHPLYRIFWLPSIRRMDRVIVNSFYSAKLAQAVGIPNHKTCIINPGVTLPTKVPSEDMIAAFRERHKLGKSRLLLSVGRLTGRKGLKEFVQYSLPEIIKAMPDTILVIIGDEPKDSLYAKRQSIASIQETADINGLGDHIRFLGWMPMDAEDLQTAFYTSSVHIFPVRHSDSDPEGFGMVAIEAAAYGLPTAAFASGGITDSVAEGASGLLAAPGDYVSLAQNTVELIEHKERYRKSAIEYANQFDWKIFGSKLRQSITHASSKAQK